MASPRSLYRNIHFYDARRPDEPLGGVLQNGSITENNFLDMLEILLVTDRCPFVVRHRTADHTISRIDDRLAVGAYDILCPSTIQLTDELWVHRVKSHNISGRQDSFRDTVRARDGRCVMTGHVNPINLWTAFEAAHIFPLDKEDLWRQWNFNRYITDMDGTTNVSKISSPQNGFLLLSHIHQYFNQYLLSVNPDDGYKIIAFSPDFIGMDGRVLDPVCRLPHDPHRVSDILLRWHFRQSVLANMRGGGEPLFEYDFPPGTDMVKEISQGPYPKERFESELAARLGFAAVDNS